MHSGSTSCPHWICGVCLCVCGCVCVCTLPRHVLSKLSKSSLPSSHKVYVLATRAAISIENGIWGMPSGNMTGTSQSESQTSEQASWHMLLIRLMYVSVYYISHILYTRTAYICNVLVINTELYWLTVMESGPNCWHAVRAYPFRRLCLIWDTDTEWHTDTDTYSSTDNYRYIWLPVCLPVGAIRNFCLLLTLLTFFRRPRYDFDCCQYHAYATYALHSSGTARIAYRL